MAKKSNKTVFVRQECGYESAKWMGQCICGAWNTMVEEKVVDINQEDKRRRASVSVGSKGPAGAGRPSKLSEVRSGEKARIDTGIGELNRVLGGGLVEGSLTLISARTRHRKIDDNNTGSSSYSSGERDSAVCFRGGIGGADQDEGRQSVRQPFRETVHPGGNQYREHRGGV